jgi:hypothetical protein
MLQNIRPDYLFSYWVFAWYILYITGILTHNPKFAILVALLENIVVLVSMLYLRVNPKKIYYFFIMILLVKGIPLWTLRKTTITKRDVAATIGLLLMYVGWIIWDEKVNASFKAYMQMLDPTIQTPGMLLLSRVFG